MTADPALVPPLRACEGGCGAFVSIGRCLRCQRGEPVKLTGIINSPITPTIAEVGDIPLALLPLPGPIIPDPASYLGVPLLTVTIYGVPAPQGSKKYVGHRKGKPVLVESSKKVTPWRDAVHNATVLATQGVPDGWEPLDGPLFVHMAFTLPRPKSIPAGDPRREHGMPTVYPDKSKLERSTEDGMTTGGAWRDDALIVDGGQRKRYVGHPEALDQPGAVVRVWRMPCDN